MIIRLLISALICVFLYLPPVQAGDISERVQTLKQLAHTDRPALKEKIDALQQQKTITAYLILGKLYASLPNEYGLNISDDAKAMAYYRKALELAEKKNTQGSDTNAARRAVARQLLLGQGVEKNTQKAVKLLKTAIVEGDAAAAYEYAHILEKGLDGNEPAVEEAARWYRFATRYQHGRAAMALASMYRRELLKAPESNTARDLAALGLSLLQAKAAKGNPGAAWEVGQVYALGEGVEQDLTKAVTWYEKAAAKDHVEALRALGRLYSRGKGVAKDRRKAAEYVIRAAKAGSMSAALDLGRRLSAGDTHFLDIEITVALEWMEKLAKSGHSGAINQLSKYYLRTGDTEKALTYLNESAEQGVMSSMLTLFRLYRDGVMVAGDDVKAHSYLDMASQSARIPADIHKLAKFYYEQKNIPAAITLATKAAKKGYQPAMMYLADHYSKGLFGEREYSKAFRWYKVAADQGNVEAMVAVGQACSRGLGTGRDDQQAATYLKRALANIGDKDYGYMAKIGVAYKQGRGLPVDLDKAFYWFERSARGKDPQGLVEFARLIMWGGAEQYEASYALELLNEAAEMDTVKAFLELGLIHQGGDLVPVDLKRAFDYFIRAADVADGGDAEAMRQVGLAYIGGFGVERNVARGIGYLKRAANQRSGLAMLDLAHTYLYPPAGGEADSEQFIHWVKRAAEEQVPDAEYYMGMAYLNGEYGLPVDQARAKKWLKRAAVQEHHFARVAYKKLRPADAYSDAH